MNENISYNLQRIILLESHFRREATIDFTSDQKENSINIRTEDTTEENILTVSVTVTFVTLCNEIKEIDAKIQMLGIFEIVSEELLPADDFAKINAPAIIYPFIREHLSTVSLKAGINPILLPPVNFVALANK